MESSTSSDFARKTRNESLSLDGIPGLEKWSFTSNDELAGTQFFDFETAQNVRATFIRGNNDLILVENPALRLCVHFIFEDSGAFRIASKSKVYVYSVRIVSPVVHVSFPHHRVAFAPKNT
jgi:hypothetical protein